MNYANGEISEHAGTKLAIIYRRCGEIHSYFGNKRLADSKSKKEALKRISEVIDGQGKLF